MVAVIAAIILVSMASCRNKKADTATDPEILVQVGDSVLTMSDVTRRIPHGLDPADSALMFQGIVDKWVSELVLLDVAENNITDMNRIDRMTEAYRNSLIVNEYLASMAEQSKGAVSEERVQQYYDTHHDEFVLKQPLVKGGFIRVDDGDRQLDNLRRWMSQFSDESIDNIEKKGLRNATGYEYFRDTWYEWSAVADRIPYRFGDADVFLRSNRNFETTVDGSVYLLHISDYIPTGKDMPYEFAKGKIREILRAQESANQRDRLRTDIYSKKIKDGFLKPGLYDPVKGEMKKK